MTKRTGVITTACWAVLVSGVFATGQEKQGSAAKPMTAEQAKKLKNPVPYTKKSIAQGRALFLRYCTDCHGTDGKAMVDVVANATDLTAPEGWKNGTSDGEAFRSIHDGAGASMPSFRNQIHDDEQIWQLVNYIHSLWPAGKRPPLQEDGSGGGAPDKTGGRKSP